MTTRRWRRSLARAAPGARAAALALATPCGVAWPSVATAAEEAGGAPEGVRAASPRTARASLVVTRARGAEDCPDEAQLAARVGRLTGRGLMVPGHPGQFGTTFHVELVRELGVLRARVVAAGERTGERLLEDVSRDCSSLGEAVATTLALLVEAEPDAPPPVLLPNAPGPPDAGVRAASGDPGSESASTPRLAIGAGAGVALGVLAEPGPAWGVDATLSIGALTLSAGMVGVASQTIRVAPGRVDVSLLGGTVHACWAAFRPSRVARGELCAAAALAALSARGSGFDQDGSAVRPWLGVGPGAALHGVIFGPLGWALRLDGLAVATRESLSVTGAGPALTPSSLAAVAAVGLEVAP